MQPLIIGYSVYFAFCMTFVHSMTVFALFYFQCEEILLGNTEGNSYYLKWEPSYLVGQQQWLACDSENPAWSNVRPPDGIVCCCFLEQETLPTLPQSTRLY